MSTSCETTSGSCATGTATGLCETQGSCSPCGGQCPCGGGCGGDPVTCGTIMWGQSFFQAMKAVQVDLLKEKIRKGWGGTMEKAADIILDAMGVKWQSMLKEAEVKASVREKLQRLWRESEK